MPYGLNTYKLASTIQGEAAPGAGQFAVAATMQNRLQQGIDTPTSIFSTGSFAANNHFTQPGPQALALADAVNNGTVSQYGNPGNATYYNGQGGRSYSAYAQGGAIIGGNAYSDQYNQPPSSAFQAPVYGGQSGVTSASASGSTYTGAGGAPTGTTEGAITITPGGPPVEGRYGVSDGSGTPTTLTGPLPTFANGMTPNQMGNPTPYIGPAGNAPAFTQGNNGALSSGVPGSGLANSGLPGTDGTQGPGNYANTPAPPTPQVPGVTTPQNLTPGTVTPDTSFNSPSGTPVSITDISGAGSVAGAAVGQSVQNAGSQLSQSISSASQTAASVGTNLLGSLLTGGTDWLVRGAIIALALALLIGAFFFYNSDRGGSEKIVPIPV